MAQMAETGLSESEYKKIKCNCKTDALIKDLEQITDIRAKRYILREMILLAVADHELQDEEVEDLHKIGKGMGISEEKSMISLSGPPAASNGSWRASNWLKKIYNTQRHE